LIFQVCDPVGQGFISSPARPGGNVTGLASFSPQTGVKQLEFLKEGVPSVARAAVLWNPQNPGNVIAMKELEKAAQTLGVQIELSEIRVPEHLIDALDLVARSNLTASSHWRIKLRSGIALSSWNLRGGFDVPRCLHFENS
jgi:putative ABC transport system substrate-binding protein